MRVVLQVVSQASVKIDGYNHFESIGQGYVLLVGFCEGDTKVVVDKIVKKIINLRVFIDSDNKMNLSLKDVQGSILSISQFTLYVDVKKGNRPSFIKALKPNDATILYDYFNSLLQEANLDVKCGIFGSDMQVSLCNEGPITIIMDSESM